MYIFWRIPFHIMMQYQIIWIIKSLTTRELFKYLPGLKKSLWESSFWLCSFFVYSASRYGSERIIRRYVQLQLESTRQV